jgi:hypothetical protein
LRKYFSKSVLKTNKLDQPVLEHYPSVPDGVPFYPFNSKVVEAAYIAPATIYTAQTTTKDTSNQNNKEATPENDTEILEEDQNSESILAEVN